jgi:DNA-binding NarL/FixJ family response regulator
MCSFFSSDPLRFRYRNSGACPATLPPNVNTLEVRDRYVYMYSPMRNVSKKKAQSNSMLVIGDLGLFSASLTQFLRSNAESVETEQSVEAGDALPVVIRTQPQIVLADMRKENRTWIKLIGQIKAANPNIKVLVTCSREDAHSANRVLRAGADGYILRDESPDEIMSALRDVLAGRLYVSESVLSATSKPGRLSGKKSPARQSESVASTDFWNPGKWTRATLKSSISAV